MPQPSNELNELKRWLQKIAQEEYENFAEIHGTRPFNAFFDPSHDLAIGGKESQLSALFARDPHAIDMTKDALAREGFRAFEPMAGAVQVGQSDPVRAPTHLALHTTAYQVARIFTGAAYDSSDSCPFVIKPIKRIPLVEPGQQTSNLQLSIEIYPYVFPLSYTRLLLDKKSLVQRILKKAMANDTPPYLFTGSIEDIGLLPDGTPVVMHTHAIRKASGSQSDRAKLEEARKGIGIINDLFSWRDEAKKEKRFAFFPQTETGQLFDVVPDAEITKMRTEYENTQEPLIEFDLHYLSKGFYRRASHHLAQRDASALEHYQEATDETSEPEVKRALSPGEIKPGQWPTLLRGNATPPHPAARPALRALEQSQGTGGRGR